MLDIASLPEGLSAVRRLGVVADTHIPDRVRSLHPDLLPGLMAGNAEVILHAGDICSPAVLAELSQVAPVVAVRGNRDWAFAGALPWARSFTAGGIRVAMQHGMGNFWHYWWDKLKFATVGYRFARYKRLLLHSMPGHDVMIFGHTHRAVNLAEDGILFFNPGSAAVTPGSLPAPSFGMLTLDGLGGVTGEIISMRRIPVQAGNWVME